MRMFVFPQLGRRTLIFCFLLLSASLRVATQTKASSFDALVSQATAAREQNDISRATELYSQAVEIDPKWADGWWFLGSLRYDAGAYAEARDALSRYIELTSSTGPASALRGLCEFETADYAQALSDIERGIAAGAANQSGNEQILRYHEGLALTKLGRFQDALKAYSFFAERKITSPELMVALGLAGLRMPLLPRELPADQEPLVTAAGSAAFEFISGDQDGAQKAFEELFRQFPRAKNTHYLYGSLLFKTDGDAALSEFRRELEVVPSNTEAAVMGAWILLLRNRPAEALPFAQKAVEQQPDSAPAELVLGKSLEGTGDLQGSIEHLEHALKLEPDNLEVHIALAKSYSKSGRREDARRERILCLQLTQADASTSASP